MELEETIKKIETNYEFSKQEKARIVNIVNICQKNKFQNEEWIRVLFLNKNTSKIKYLGPQLSFAKL